MTDISAPVSMRKSDEERISRMKRRFCFGLVEWLVCADSESNCLSILALAIPGGTIDGVSSWTPTRFLFRL